MIQAFIFNWVGHEANALALQRSLRPLVPTTVINSDDRVRGRHPDWLDVGEEAYFSQQWNAALERFDGELLLHVQADARLDDPEALLQRGAAACTRHGLGVYEPDVDYTDIRYQQARLQAFEPRLLRVPATDCTCWMIHADLLRAMPPVDVTVNRYGWGICAVVAALGRRLGRPCARDYALRVDHPRGRGYPSWAALRQRAAYLQTLDSDLRTEIARIDQEVVALQDRSGRLPMGRPSATSPRKPAMSRR